MGTPLESPSKQLYTQNLNLANTFTPKTRIPHALFTQTFILQTLSYPKHLSLNKFFKIITPIPQSHLLIKNPYPSKTFSRKPQQKRNGKIQLLKRLFITYAAPSN